MKASKRHRFETLAVHAGHGVDAAQARSRRRSRFRPPSSAPKMAAIPAGTSTRAAATRTGMRWKPLLPHWKAAGALAFASGQAAVSAVLQTLAPGDHVLSPDDLYHGTRKRPQVMARWGLQADFVDMRDPTNVENALQPGNTAGVDRNAIQPAPENRRRCPCRRTCSQAGATVPSITPSRSHLAASVGVRRDIAMHSTTKYLGGHSDVLGGTLILRDDERFAKVSARRQSLGGAVPSPFDCWLLLRSLPTLAVRMRGRPPAPR